MWQKHRDKEKVEGQCRYPLFDSNRQQGDEGSAQLQETTKVNETELINPGDSGPDGFVTATHKKTKKKTKG